MFDQWNHSHDVAGLLLLRRVRRILRIVEHDHWLLDETSHWSGMSADGFIRDRRHQLVRATTMPRFDGSFGDFEVVAVVGVAARVQFQTWIQWNLAFRMQIEFYIGIIVAGTIITFWA